jgi:hypothetical protein
MKQPQIRQFVQRFLDVKGGGVAREDGDLLRVRLPSDGGDGGTAELTLAFGTRTHRCHPGAEFVAIGSAFLDRVVGDALALGRRAVVCLPAPQSVRQPRIPPALPSVPGFQWGGPVRASRPLFLFVYLAEYHTIDVRDDLVLIAYDPARGRALASPQALLRAFARGNCHPEEGWPPASPDPTAGDLWRSLDLLDRRLQRRSRLVKEASAIEIARETANIEAYYRQLIDEARHPVGRGRQTVEEEAERVRQLQLDWKRRVQEVSGFWEACGDVRISAIGTVMEPCWIFPLRREGARARKHALRPPYGVADCRGGVLEPVCALCGAGLCGSASLMGQDLICESHG